MSKVTKGKRRYQEVWEILRNRTVTEITAKRPPSGLLVQLQMPFKTFAKAISKEKNLDNPFKRAFPNATLECKLVHLPDLTNPSKLVPHIKLSLVIIPKLTADMFDTVKNPFSLENENVATSTTESKATGETKADSWSENTAS